MKSPKSWGNSVAYNVKNNSSRMGRFEVDVYSVCVCTYCHVCVCSVSSLNTRQAMLLFNCHVLSRNSKPVFEDSSNIFELVGFCKASNNSDIYCIFTPVRLWASCFTCIILFNPVGFNIISI